MPDVFEDTLSEITGITAGAAPELQQEQTQAAPAESNAFEQALADKIQESPAQSPEHDVPEPGGGRER